MIGQTLGHYRIEAKLGEGGMGVVYKARDAHLDRPVAIKVLRPETVTNPERRRRFVQEAKAASALNHPNIVHIYDIDQADGTDFIAMEYVLGKTLDQLIGRKGLNLGEVLKYAVQIADALAKAHSAGIVHRDLKPANIMVTPDGIVKLLDFGLAKLIEPLEADELAPTETLRAHTEEGTIVGTVAYMSPEQAEGKKVDARSDIFSFGSVLYEMVTGRRAFHGETKLSTLSAILHQEPPPASQVAEGMPAELERILARCLRKDPERRLQLMKDVKIALEELREESESGPLVAPSPPRQRRYLWWAAGAVAALLALGATAWFGLLHPSPAAAPSIAVLPFRNLSPDKDNEFLSDGLADDIAHALTRFAGLRVVAGASARTFRGKELDLREVGSKLNVAHVLEGNLRKSGERIRLTVQLYRVSDSSLIWGRSYDREMASVFAIQEEVARSITGELRLKPAGARVAQRRHTENTEAYQLYLKGRYYHQRQTAEAMARSKECFEQAIALDPKYALAYYGLAEFFWSSSFYASVPPRDLLVRGRAAAEKAVELDDTLAEGHAMLGIFRALLDFDWRGGEQEFLQALELDPGSAASRDRYAVYLLPALGRLEEAVAQMNQVVESDPLSAYYQYHLAAVLILARQPDRAMEVSRKALALDPNYWLPHWALGWAYASKQQFPEAIQALEKASRLSGPDLVVSSWLSSIYARAGRGGEAQKLFSQLQEARRGRYFSPYFLAIIHLGRGDKDRSLALLAQAVDDRMPLIFWLPASWAFDPLRSDPRFQALLRTMKLEDRR